MMAMDELTRNNQRLTALHGLNRLYADTLITYLRGYWRKDAVEIEDTISDILIDMVSAQADGRSAKAHFGADPQTAADEIVRELAPAPVSQWLMRLWPGLNGVGLLTLGGALLDHALDEPFDLVNGVTWVACLFLVVLIGPLFRGISFNHLQRRTKWRIALGVCLFIGLYVLISRLPEIPLTASLTSWVVGGLSGVMLVVNGGLSLRWPRLARPWCLAWVLGGGLTLLLLATQIGLWGQAAGFLALAATGLGIEIWQNSHLHFVAQMRP